MAKNEVSMSATGDIPNRPYYRIGEVSRLVGVEPQVLRYWEENVATIQPKLTAGNQRRYRRQDVVLFRQIRKMLGDDVCSVEELDAMLGISQEKKQKHTAPVGQAVAKEDQTRLLRMKEKLEQIAEMCKRAV